MATERVPEPLITIVKINIHWKTVRFANDFIIANSHNYVSRFHQSPQDYAAFLSDCTLNWTAVTAFLEQSKSVIYYAYNYFLN